MVALLFTMLAAWKVHKMLDSNQLAAKHTDAVWGIKWIDKGTEQGNVSQHIDRWTRNGWSIKVKALI